MNYYHLTTHPLAQKITIFLDEQAAAKKLWIDFSKKVKAINLCGWNFFFEGDKKPNKHWIKSKNQKWDNVAYTPSRKTVEGMAMVNELSSFPEVLGAGVGLMLNLFGNEPALNIITEDSSKCLIFEALQEHGYIGFKRVNGEIYMEGSGFWLFGNLEGAKEISNIEYREAK